jgi:2-oxoacid:acceptor oxidoreductase gamma subunit (pyruvate/2-ketoisovalerate family)
LVEIRFHGLGGQGAVTLVRLLALAGDKAGWFVQAAPFFGAERRGAPVKTFLRFDDRPIYRMSQIYRPDLLVVMSDSLVDLALSEGVREDTVLLVNDGPGSESRYQAMPFRVHLVDATGIALDLGLEVDGMPAVNIPVYGAISYVSNLVNLEVITEVIRETIRGPRREKSMEAARRGFTSVREVGKKGRAKRP